MRLPRVSIAGSMALILIAAFDCVGVGWMLASPFVPIRHSRGQTIDGDILRRKVMAEAVVPMANILAIVGVWGRRRPGRAGFLVAGGLAMVTAGVVAVLTGERCYLSNAYLLQPLIEPYLRAIHRGLERLPILIWQLYGLSLALLIHGGPTTAAQLTPALAGWWFDRRYEIRRRPAGPPTAEAAGARESASASPI